MGNKGDPYNLFYWFSDVPALHTAVSVRYVQPTRSCCGRGGCQGFLKTFIFTWEVKPNLNKIFLDAHTIF